MRTKTIWLTALVVLATVSGARAVDGLGVGLILGEPSGISIKKWITNDRAFDAAAAWSMSEHERFQFHADYLIHKFGWFNPGVQPGKLPFYYGIGGRIRLANDNYRYWHDERYHSDRTSIGVRVPFGIEYLAASAPLEFFLEIVPVLDLAPDTHVGVNGAIGFRYYFR
ncbi:MAG: DUF3996 domain-containing protein [Candidatus Cloacimonetes bacterium]|nr:DUF3996 domain-containing protein [Candidatus Cloacimonadota bacterium]